MVFHGVDVDGLVKLYHHLDGNRHVAIADARIGPQPGWRGGIGHRRHFRGEGPMHLVDARSQVQGIACQVGHIGRHINQVLTVIGQGRIGSELDVVTIAFEFSRHRGARWTVNANAGMVFHGVDVDGFIKLYYDFTGYRHVGFIQSRLRT